MKPIILSVAAIAMLIFLQPIDALAESAQIHSTSITGHIINSKTGSHIPYVTIELKGTTIAVFADNTGHYTLLDLPEGEFMMQATKVGHTIAQKKVKTAKGETLEVNFEMQEEAVTMNEVVVTATRNETDKSKSPTIVNVLSQKNFERTASATLSETLNFGAGLRMEFNCSNCGVPQLRINGLDGQYSQILLDSRPIFSSLATVYGLEQIPTAMVERVEVIRGGGSALFGSNAIGGVVNIITKEPMRNTVTLSNTTGFLDSKTSDMTTSLGGSFISEDRKAGIYIFGMIRDRNAYHRDDDGFSEIPELGSETLGFRGHYKTGTYSRITAEYHHIREFRRGGNNLDRPPHEADIAEQLRHEINGGGVRFDGYHPNQRHRFSVYGSGQVIDRNSYFGTGMNLNAYGTTLDRTLVGGGQYTYSFHRLFFAPSQLTAGAEYNQDELNDRMLGYDRYIDQKTRTFGGFLQNEWQSNEFNFVLGARADKNNLIERVILSPRASFRYTPNEHIGLRGSYSSGYRAPQVYNEDLHVAAVGGEVALIKLAEGLRPEYSHSLSASADLYETFGEFQANLLIEGFYTRLKDVFILSEIGRDDLGNLLLERRNGTGATVRGINLEAMLGLPGKMEFQMGYTLQRSRYNEPEVWSQDPAVPAQRRMFRSPDNYGYMTANVYITPAFKTSLFGTYTGKMDVPHYAGYVEKDVVTVSPRFFDMGLRASYQISMGRSGKMEFSLGVKNVLDHFQRDLDQGLLRDAGYIYGPALPRTIFFGVKLTL